MTSPWSKNHIVREQTPTSLSIILQAWGSFNSSLSKSFLPSKLISFSVIHVLFHSANYDDSIIQTIHWPDPCHPSPIIKSSLCQELSAKLNQLLEREIAFELLNKIPKKFWSKKNILHFPLQWTCTATPPPIIKSSLCQELNVKLNQLLEGEIAFELLN